MSAAAIEQAPIEVCTPPELVFDADTHTYSVRGKRLDSVTQILRRLSNFEGIPVGVLEHKRQLGQAVHAALDFMDRGIELDPASIDPEAVPYIRAYQDFRHEHGWRVLASEWRGYEPLLDVAGTNDRVFLLPNMSRAVVDLKCTAALPASVGAQTAAYKRIWNRWNPQLLATKRFALRLLPDGNYRLVECRDPDDLEIFMAERLSLNWRRKHGIE